MIHVFTLAAAAASSLTNAGQPDYGRFRWAVAWARSAQESESG